MRHPGAVAAALIGAFDGDAVAVEPEGDRPAPPGIDPIDDRHHRAAAKAGRSLADNRVEATALHWECRCAVTIATVRPRAV